MRVIYLNKKKTFALEDTCMALGYFDGLHLGHQKLLSKVCEIAKQKGLKKALMTFDKHPKEVLMKTTFSYLSTVEDKIKILESYAFDYLIIIPFDQEFSKISPSLFIQEYLIKHQVKHIVCGFDYRFGYLGSGNTELLQKESEPYLEVTVMKEQKYQDHKISSTYIKTVLQEGNVMLANILLHRFYSITGEVIYGFQRGKKELGFPTANIAYNKYFIPQKGVYGVKVIIDDILYFGMANIGYNPTYGDLQKESLEVHIFHFNQDIYGKIITVLFCKQIRREVRFSSKEHLIEQLYKDQEKIQNYFKI